MRAAGGASGCRRLHLKSPKNFLAGSMTARIWSLKSASRFLPQAGDVQRLGRGHCDGRGDRPAQYLLGTDAGNGRRAVEARSGSNRPGCWLTAMPAPNGSASSKAIVEGDAKCRSDRCSLDHCQSGPAIGSWPTLLANIPATVGRETTRLWNARALAGAECALVQRRFTAAAFPKVRGRRSKKTCFPRDRPEIMGSESFESHLQEVESLPFAATQHHVYTHRPAA